VGGSFKDTEGKPFTSQDIRFTMRDNKLYAIALAWPGNSRMIIKSLATGAPAAPRRIKSVRLLGASGAPKWKHSAEGLTVELPAEKPCDYAFALEITPAR
jgi:alpha-L-fucosidase